MKEKQGESTFHRLLGLVTRNFGLKLLALALAVVTYELLSPEATPEAGLFPAATPAATEEKPKPAPVTSPASAEQPAAAPRKLPAQRPVSPRQPVPVKTPPPVKHNVPNVPNR